MVTILGVESPLQEKLEEVAEELGLTEVTIRCVLHEAQELQITGSDDRYQIASSAPSLFFRGLVVLAETLIAKPKEVSVCEQVRYPDFGFMADVSRNAVLTTQSCHNMIKYLACMGYSNFQLYMEDTYQLADEPYFGYFRGAYTGEELCEIEKTAHSYGMTFLPCIQTLAHLSAYVKWNIADIQNKRDVDDILLIGDDGTYTLIDKMFQALSHLKTRRVNIGMDEAHLVGLGRYLNQHGYHERSLLMCQHLERVLDIAEHYGFECQMWSDMFFQLLTASKNYEGELRISPEVRDYLEKLKSRVTLIYWDYYQTTEESYSRKWESHHQLSDKLAFAGGAWKWIGYTPDNHFGLQIAPEAHKACQKHGIGNVTVTAWGDNGAEASVFSILPTLQAWAELNYRDNLEKLPAHFQCLYQMSLDDFLSIDAANLTPSNPRTSSGFNPNRYLLYQDILCPLLDQHIDHEKDAKHYETSTEKLESVCSRAGKWQYLFATQATLCRLLAIKASLAHTIRLAYQNKNIVVLTDSRQKLVELLLLLENFKQAHSHQWLAENKIFGLDTIDIRLGGLRARIERAIERISDFIDGRINRIEELEVAILPYDDFYQKDGIVATTANQWHLLATASTISTT